ncbi:MAG TPA: hypothetical protein VER33_12550 [Polyangiaceae bacterium]|nr:hypothetical protein [Polyangiaceae bacterium]
MATSTPVPSLLKPETRLERSGRTAAAVSRTVRTATPLLALLTLITSLGAACARPGAVAQSGSSADRAPLDTASARGGRLYDNWAAEKRLGATFVPDNAKTPELDGKGGPNGNGTLNDRNGQALPNRGHDYRLKNLFGWDLRGADGIYGAAYQAKPYVLPTNLLLSTRSQAELSAWLKQGDVNVPAYGSVLDDAELESLAGFIVAVRDRKLPHPDDFFRLSARAPKNYELMAGGDSELGKSYYGDRCAGCHGPSGVKVTIDDTESVGSLGRSSAYEVWLKLLNGHPGSKMGPQVHAGDGRDQARTILNLLGALCDRSAFPPLDPKHDAPAADARCAAYGG